MTLGDEVTVQIKAAHVRLTYDWLALILVNLLKVPMYIPPEADRISHMFNISPTYV